jgi:transcriptional regulator with XRE-family HTH domain
VEQSIQVAAQQIDHWTSASVDDYVHKITFDFIAQLEKKMASSDLSQTELAKKLGVSEGAVSRILNNPQNLTLKTIVRYAQALGTKVALVAYEDDDPQNQLGPIDSEIFSVCWHRCGEPHDFWSLENNYQAVVTTTISVHWVAFEQLALPVVENQIDPWGDWCSMSWKAASFEFTYEEQMIPVSLLISKTGSNQQYA